MYFTSAIFLASWSSVIAASPFISRQTPSAICSPNFEGVGVSITNSAREWGIPPPIGVDSDVTSDPLGLVLGDVEFRLEQTGQPDTSYIIKPVNTVDLAVAVRDDGTLKVASINANDATQIWTVTCDFCNTNAASFVGLFANGCNITSVPTGNCVQIGTEATDPMFIAPCNGQDSQNFDFHTLVPN